jgi:hypothetical protein
MRWSFGPSQGQVRLHQLNYPGMCLGVLLDVSVRGPEVAVPGQHLNIPE